MAIVGSCLENFKAAPSDLKNSSHPWASHNDLGHLLLIDRNLQGCLLSGLVAAEVVAGMPRWDYMPGRSELHQKLAERQVQCSLGQEERVQAGTALQDGLSTNLKEIQSFRSFVDSAGHHDHFEQVVG